MYFTYILLIVLVVYLTDYVTYSQVTKCHENCESDRRIVGPTKQPNTSHPFKIDRFPTPDFEFCKMGCSMLYIEAPKHITCVKLCDHVYRYDATTGYIDMMEQARLQCIDGCSIGLKVCDAGYRCTDGNMLPCTAGTYREPISDFSFLELQRTQQCQPCPRGRYRSSNKGTSPDDCSLCPVGTYVDTEGSKSVSDCKRCPAGKNAEEYGMALCKCITEQSCKLYDRLQGVYFFNAEFNKDGQHIDYFRETTPFIGFS